MKYRKKPVEIEAIQLKKSNTNVIISWANEWLQHIDKVYDGRQLVALSIPTLEGDMKANFGDWIIRGVDGEFYPCKSDIFEKTYEAIQ